MDKTRLVFLKLGGSLITDKHQEASARASVIARLAGELAAARQTDPSLRILLGNGAGSFGHMPAKRHHTRQGVHTYEQWLGFSQVWQQAAALNRMLIAALYEANLPAIAFPPSAMIHASGGQVVDWTIYPLQAALAADLLPVVYGDVVFDEQLGGTIFSTEDLFEYLAVHLQPERILLAGIEAGVWADYPANHHFVQHITPQSFQGARLALTGSGATDVTGGMFSKVVQSLRLVEAVPGLEVLIFSGEQAGNVQSALGGGSPGTRICKI